jgi:hypothetical protein
MGGLGVGCAAASVVLFMILLAVGLPLWGMVIEPWWEAQDLYRAADEALMRPYVQDADVYLDFLDGNRLDVDLTPEATEADAADLWCEVLLGAKGGGVTVSQGYDGMFEAPKRKECAARDQMP